ncbi:hypothetical protein V2K00_11610 [Pseudomonas alliivorans]|nr:hypothetical protein [Pseudomonas alliivorans]
MKNDEDKRFRLYELLLSLDSANTKLMQLVCVGVPLKDSRWLQAAGELTLCYEKLKLELS